MSLSRGRKRITINGALLSRGQTITFERQQKDKECFKAADGKTRCKNENQGTFFNRSKFIEPKDAKPTEADKFKSIQEIEPKCFTAASGKKICENDKGQQIDIGKGKSDRSFFSFENFKGNVKEKISTAKAGTVATFNFKDTVIQFVLDNENKLRAAKVIADAVAFGLIAVGQISLATGIGVGVGAGFIAAGGVIGAGSLALGKATDAVVDTIKKIQQLEDAVEVARQALSPKIDRDALIEENSVAIDNREDELLNMKKSELQERASELDLTGVSLFRKSELARVIAIEEIIGSAGRDVVEPTIGKSLIATDLEKLIKIVKGKEVRADKIKIIAQNLNISEDDAEVLLNEREELNKKKKDKKDREKEFKDSDDIIKEQKKKDEILKKKEDDLIEVLDISREEAQRLLTVQDDKKRQDKVDKDLEDRAEELKRLQIEFDAIIAQELIEQDEDEEKREEISSEELAKEDTTKDGETPERESPLPPAGVLNVEDPFSPRVLSPKGKGLKQKRFFGEDEDLPVIASTIGLDIGEDEDLPSIEITEISPMASEDISEEVEDIDEEIVDFVFSNVDNTDIFNANNKNASRRKIDASAKTGLFTKPKNFNNPDRLLPEQIQGALGTSPKDKQMAATLNINEGINIYNEITRELTNQTTSSCRDYIRSMKTKIAILPENLKQELRDYCASLLQDDE